MLWALFFPCWSLSHLTTSRKAKWLSLTFVMRLYQKQLSGPRQFLTNESLLKIIKIAFYFILKDFSFLRYLHFYPDFLVIHMWKWLDKKVGKQVIKRHVLPNISTCEGNQTMKFLQLIENIVRNICFRKLCRKSGRENNTRSPFVLFKKKFNSGRIIGQHLSFNIL